MATLTTSSNSASACASVSATTASWRRITVSLPAMQWRLRGFPAEEDPRTTVRELRRHTEESSPAGNDSTTKTGGDV